MANELTEKSCLEAELLLGYKLFKQQEKLKSQKETLQEQTNAVRDYEAERERNLYLPQNVPNAYAEYSKYCETKRKRNLEDRNKKQQEQINERIAVCKKKIIVWSIVCFIILIIGIILTVFAKNEGEKLYNDSSFMFVPLFFLVITPVGFVFTPIAITQLVTIRKVKIESAKSSATSYKTDTYRAVDFPTYAKKYYGTAKLIEEYDRQHADSLAKKKAIVEKVNEQIALCDQTLLALEDVYKNAVKKMTVIPVYYFKPDAVEKMLFFYVNKRADNVRDLINLYETTVFQEAVLRSLKEIAISVDRLAETVRGSFQRLGLQLGVINESIRENTQIQRLNSQKLSEIKDETARHYMEIVDAIGEVEIISNSYLTTNVTTEITVE